MKKKKLYTNKVPITLEVIEVNEVRADPIINTQFILLDQPLFDIVPNPNKNGVIIVRTKKNKITPDYINS